MAEDDALLLFSMHTTFGLWLYKSNNLFTIEEKSDGNPKYTFSSQNHLKIKYYCLLWMVNHFTWKHTLLYKVNI